MTSFLNRYMQVKCQYNALDLRQRVLILCSILSIVYMAWYFLLEIPISKKIKQHHAENIYLSGRSSADNNSFSSIDATDIASLNSQLAIVKREVDQLNNDLSHYFSIIGSVDELLVIVKELLESNEGLIVEELKLLPTEVVNIENYYDINEGIDEGEGEHNDAELNQDEIVLYKHKIHLQLKGNYVDLTRYLQQVESLKWGLFTQDISYKVNKHPDAAISLLLYTLSFEGSVIDA